MKRRLPGFLAALLCLNGSAANYTFTTIAGLAGTAGTADGTNSAARFRNPACLAIGKTGDLYVTDVQNHTVRLVRKTGADYVVTTIAGQPGQSGAVDGTNGNARFYRPTGIAIDADGALFIADRYNNTIRKITPEGTNWIVSTIAGAALIRGTDDGPGSDARFAQPSGIAVDPDGNLLVTDTGNSLIRFIQRDGTNWVVSSIAGFADIYGGFFDGYGVDARFNAPWGIAVRGSNAFVADWGNHAVRLMTKSDPEWFVETLAGFSGNPGSSNGPASTATFNAPSGIAVDQQGRLFLADQSNEAIRQLEPGGPEWVVSTIAGLPGSIGSADGTGSDARFRNPWGIVVDPQQTLYVADYSNHTIRLGIPQVSAPQLSIQMLDGELVVSWPAAATNFVLEASEDLSLSGWKPASGAILKGDQFWFRIQTNSAAGFFRLRGQ